MSQLQLFNKFKLAIINDPCMTGKWLADQFIVDYFCDDDGFKGTTKRNFIQWFPNYVPCIMTGIITKMFLIVLFHGPYFAIQEE